MPGLCVTLVSTGRGQLGCCQLRLESCRPQPSKARAVSPPKRGPIPLLSRNLKAPPFGRWSDHPTLLGRTGYC